MKRRFISHVCALVIASIVSSTAFAGALKCSDIFIGKFTSAPVVTLNSQEKQMARMFLKRLDENQVSDKKVQLEIQKFKSFVLWSLENNPLDYSHPSYKKKISYMAKSLNRAVLESSSHRNEHYISKHFALIKDIQERLNKGTQLQNPTYGELAILADDFTVAIELVLSWKPNVDWISTLDFHLRKNSPEEILAATRTDIQKALSIAPYVMIDHIGNATLAEFVNSFFLPTMRLGIVAREITYDGSFGLNSKGVPAMSYSGPRTFYSHDLTNHGFKGLDSRFVTFVRQENAFKVKTDPKDILSFLNKTAQQFEFYLQLDKFKATLPPVQQEALNSILFIMYHESTEIAFNGSPSFTKEALQNAIPRMESTIREEIVKRIPLDNDIGQELPQLRALTEEKVIEVINNMMAQILSW